MYTVNNNVIGKQIVFVDVSNLKMRKAKVKKFY